MFKFLITLLLLLPVSCARGPVFTVGQQVVVKSGFYTGCTGMVTEYVGPAYRLTAVDCYLNLPSNVKVEINWIMVQGHEIEWKAWNHYLGFGWLVSRLQQYS